MYKRARPDPLHSGTTRPSFFSRPSHGALTGTPFFAPAGTAAPAVQPKLAMGAPGDPFEQEADAMGDRVVQRMPAGAVRAGTAPSVQAKCAECREEERVQRKADVPGSMAVPSSVQQTLEGGGGGVSMQPAIRDQMESAFGSDFSDVRLHTGPSAVQLSRDLRADAFTHGTNIYFNSGKYQPDTSGGRHLLAHELTHVVQQRGVTPHLIQRAETDTSAGCSNLTDTRSDVNDRVNAVLRSTRGSPDGVHGVLGVNTSLGRTAIEDWAASLGPSKVRQPAQSATKYAGVGYGLWMQPIFPILNPTMRINDLCVGSDKLGHFFQQGFEYLGLFRRSGGDETPAEAYGRGTEAGGFGLQSTGVFSNADLEANRRGLRFYRDLLASPSLTFDIANYINANWNEENNPSHYEQSVGPTVWRNLLRGSWSGEIDRGSGPLVIVVNLDVAVDNVTISGAYGYRASDGRTISGIISNGRITHTANSLGAVTGVEIDFDWQEGSSSGRGHWSNQRERGLRGTSGFDRSRTDGGPWNLTKSPTPLQLPRSPEARRNDCMRGCEEEFERCIRSSRSGGMFCLGRRSNCLLNCGPAR